MEFAFCDDRRCDRDRLTETSCKKSARAIFLVSPPRVARHSTRRPHRSVRGLPRRASLARRPITRSRAHRQFPTAEPSERTLVRLIRRNTRDHHHVHRRGCRAVSRGDARDAHGTSQTHPELVTRALPARPVPIAHASPPRAQPGRPLVPDRLPPGRRLVPGESPISVLKRPRRAIRIPAIASSRPRADGSSPPRSRRPRGPPRLARARPRRRDASVARPPDPSRWPRRATTTWATP